VWDTADAYNYVSVASPLVIGWPFSTPWVLRSNIDLPSREVLGRYCR
jgi:hypothetical protein